METVIDCVERADLGEDCIAECSHPGECDKDVMRWVKKLGFTVDRAAAIRHYAEFGSFEREELERLSDEDLAAQILWLACGQFRECPDEGLLHMLNPRHAPRTAL